MSTPLEYESPTPRWKRGLERFLHAGSITLSHLVAAGCTWLVLVGGLTLLGMIGAILTIFDSPPGADGPGALEAAVGAVILGLFGALLGTVLGGATILVGITVDAARRPLGIAWWLALIIMPGLAMLLSVAICLTFYRPISAAPLAGLLWGLTISALFCLYWIPLGCAEGILRLVRGVVKKILGRWQKPHYGP